MSMGKKGVLLLVILVMVLSLGSMVACGENTPPQESTPPGQAIVVLNDSIVAGEVVAGTS